MTKGEEPTDVTQLLAETNYNLPNSYRSFGLDELRSPGKLDTVTNWGKYWTIGFTITRGRRAWWRDRKTVNILYVYTGDDRGWVRKIKTCFLTVCL